MTTEENAQEQWSRFVWQSSDIVIIRKSDDKSPTDTEAKPASGDHEASAAGSTDDTDGQDQTDKPFARFSNECHTTRTSGMSVMSYQRYVTGVERRRAVLKQNLDKANSLRRETGLPVRDVDLLVTETEPLLTKEEFDNRSKERAGFNRFKKERLAQANLPSPEPTNWQQQKALVFRRAFLNHKIKMAWRDRRVDGGFARQ